MVVRTGKARDKIEEQEYGRGDWPHLSASACSSPLHSPLAVAAEEEAWEQGEQGREGDKGNVMKKCSCKSANEFYLWAAGERGQVQTG